MSDESIFDKIAPPGKAFYCENGMEFKSIRDLENALKNYSLEEQKKLFYFHTRNEKNDFSAWIEGVFGFKNLASQIFRIREPQELLNALKKYESETLQKNNLKETIPEKKEKIKIEGEQKKEEEIKGNADVSREKIDALKQELNSRSDRVDKTFDRVKKLKQHSFYNKSEFEDTIEGLKERYEELARVISSHRKEGIDVSIPSMLLRNVHPKIIYFQVSQNKLDYDSIVEILDEIEQEIKYAKGVKDKNLKEEIMEELGLSKKEKEA